MPPKLEHPIKKLYLLKECHDKKIESLGRLIQKIFNTTDESHKISKTVTNAIQNLTRNTLTNKELSKSNLEKTNELIRTLKLINVSILKLRKTTNGTGRQIGLTKSYQQVVKAIVEYANKIECPTPKPKINQNPDEEFLQSIEKLKALNEFIKRAFMKNSIVCRDKDRNNNACYNVIKDLINKVKEYKQIFNDLKYNAPANTEDKLRLYLAKIRRLKSFIQKYRSEYKNYSRKYPYYKFSVHEGLNVFLNMEIAQIERIREKIKKRGKLGGSKHHKTKTTKKRIKGKQTRRNKVKNKTTIKAKNKPTTKAKNKTTIKAKNKTKKR